MNNLFSIFKNRGFQTVFIITLYLLAANRLPDDLHKFLFSISKTIQEILLWALPLVVGFFVASTLSSLKTAAPLFILAIALFEAVSNTVSVGYAYLCGLSISHSLPCCTVASAPPPYSPLWHLPFERPSWWSCQNGLFVGIMTGLAVAVFGGALLSRGITLGKKVIERFLSKVFTPIIPLFLLGFVARMHQQHFLDQIYSQCAYLIALLIVVLSFYMLFLFLIGNGLSPKKACQDFRNLFPAAGVAFTSGSGLATMPWTISGTSKNLANADFAKVVIPATTNIQQIGDCITNALFCFFLYQQFLGAPPALAIWASFTAVFVLARFTTAAVTGGAIFIMIPIYESYLSFNAEMTAIILAFNVILDPIITCANVVANGALCKIFEKVWLTLKESETC